MVFAQLPSNKTKSRPLTVAHSHVSSACFFISCLLRCVHIIYVLICLFIVCEQAKTATPHLTRFITETQRERRLEIQREQRRRKTRRQESTDRRTSFTGNSLAKTKPSAGHKQETGISQARNLGTYTT